ncbi:c-type cytochrome [Hydrogenimonas sp.]
MRQLLALLGIAVFVAIAFYVNGAGKSATSLHRHVTEKEVNACAECREERKKETVEEIRSIPYLEKYIVDVIDHGSKQNLGFKYGDMPEKMADEKAAPKIAAYVVTLAGLRPTHPEWVGEGHTFYISNCGGCHGEDGKGVHGTFPDLTRHPLLGIRKRLEKVSRGE